MGYATLVFPKHEEAIQAELNEVMLKAKAIVLGHNFTNSSMFIEWQGSREQADELTLNIEDLNSNYLVEWREKL